MEVNKGGKKEKGRAKVKKKEKKTWQITKGRNTPKQTNANGRRRQRTNDQTNEWRERIKLVHCAININNINVNK
uniref:Uncharacterized protein n=1 Tax=Trypanosoma brucei TaxID=5691 RepID=Q582Z3_9TRYP|nr:hypothetical protein, unlikely [Trypanosoma brucei]